eukprot:2439149-Rhodomonas_salina.3
MLAYAITGHRIPRGGKRVIPAVPAPTQGRLEDLAAQYAMSAPDSASQKRRMVLIPGSRRALTVRLSLGGCGMRSCSRAISAPDAAKQMHRTSKGRLLV